MRGHWCGDDIGGFLIRCIGGLHNTKIPSYLRIYQQDHEAVIPISEQLRSRGPILEAALQAHTLSRNTCLAQRAKQAHLARLSSRRDAYCDEIIAEDSQC
ncbi:hypothetical protein Tco_0869960 [Tanacetum coccineum]